jgi:endonuclease YncB( thermonuclease family)
MRSSAITPCHQASPKRCLLVLASLSLIAFPAIPHADNLVGRVVAISDGDTMTILVRQSQVRVRLADIDAPEIKQPFGTRSRQSLASMCARTTAHVEGSSKDRYGRVLGRVTCNGINANAKQVQLGMAWVFERYARRDSPLHAMQVEARGAKRGLWVDAEPIPPWEWRVRTRRLQ